MVLLIVLGDGVFIVEFGSFVLSEGIGLFYRIILERISGLIQNIVRVLWEDRIFWKVHRNKLSDSIKFMIN